MSNPLKNYKGNANPDMSFLEVNNGSSSSTAHNRSGTSHTYHFQAGERFYFYQWDGTSGGVNDMWLTITAKDQVPQTITARPGMTLETLAGVCDGRSITVASGTYTLLM